MDYIIVRLQSQSCDILMHAVTLYCRYLILQTFRVICVLCLCNSDKFVTSDVISQPICKELNHLWHKQA